MKILQPGDPCPCCGNPIPERLPANTIVLLSWLAEGRQLRAAMEGIDEDE